MKNEQKRNSTACTDKIRKTKLLKKHRCFPLARNTKGEKKRVYIKSQEENKRRHGYIT